MRWQLLDKPSTCQVWGWTGKSCWRCILASRPDRLAPSFFLWRRVLSWKPPRNNRGGPIWSVVMERLPPPLTKSLTQFTDSLTQLPNMLIQFCANKKRYLWPVLNDISKDLADAHFKVLDKLLPTSCASNMSVRISYRSCPFWWLRNLAWKPCSSFTCTSLKKFLQVTFLTQMSPVTVHLGCSTAGPRSGQQVKERGCVGPVGLCLGIVKMCHWL